MRLNIKAMVVTLGLIWGAVVLLTGVANLIWSGYGKAFLQVLASIYPGYKASGSIGDLITGILYALLDGGIFGLVLAWLYNRFLGPPLPISDDLKREEIGVLSPPIEPKRK
jgi:hypothetical protein